MKPLTLVLTPEGLRQVDGEIPLFALDMAAAIAIYVQMDAIVHLHVDAIAAHYAAKHGNAPRNPENAFSTGSWSPDAQRRADACGRKGPEMIDLHVDYRPPELMEALSTAGFAPFIVVQKHDLWTRDRYNRMNEYEQAEWDMNALDMGFHVSVEQVRRLVRLGFWSHARATAYVPNYGGH
jgi:hypothetical protein